MGVPALWSHPSCTLPGDLWMCTPDASSKHNNAFWLHLHLSGDIGGMSGAQPEDDNDGQEIAGPPAPHGRVKGIDGSRKEWRCRQSGLYAIGV